MSSLTGCLLAKFFLIQTHGNSWNSPWESKSCWCLRAQKIQGALIVMVGSKQHRLWNQEDLSSNSVCVQLGNSEQSFNLNKPRFPISLWQLNKMPEVMFNWLVIAFLSYLTKASWGTLDVFQTLSTPKLLWRWRRWHLSLIWESGYRLEVQR